MIFMSYKMDNSDTIDTFFCNLPVLGKVFTRMYSYFKKHTGITDAMHVSLGLGFGLWFTEWKVIAITAIALGLFGHVYAYIRADA
jgi:hypothetical protein